MSTTDKKRHDVRFSSNILYYSESIIDIDLGFVRFIKKNFSNSKYMDQDILKNNDELFYKSLLVSRENPNPLSVVINPIYKDSIDSLYNEILEANYDEILEMTSPLALFPIFINSIESGFLNVSILYKNEHEKQYIKKMLPEEKSFNMLYRYDPKVNLDLFNCIYMKNFSDILTTKLLTKDVFVLGYRYNLEHGEDRVLKLDILNQVHRSVQLHIVTPYKNFIEPI